jgi:succinoglycan biosynthesis protein ExoW
MINKYIPSVGVVIPFFQKDPEILGRCLASVFAQNTGHDVHFIVVIVDDDSPVPLSEALLGVDIPAHHEVVCIKRPNGGPGRARNTALDYLAGRNPNFIAFIDSDDIWHHQHISRAIEILAEDGDFFFCDHDRWNFSTSFLEDSQPFQRWRTEIDSCLIPLNDYAYEFKRGEAFYAFIADYLAQTSTVLYRFSKFRALRFDPCLRLAGEDNMFWLQLSKTARIVRLSTKKDVETGKGVNMFASSMDWSHPQAADRTAAIVLFYLKIKKTFGRDKRTRVMLRRRIVQPDAEFSQVWLRKFLKNPFESIRIIWPLVKTRVTTPLIVIWHIFRQTFKVQTNI